MGFNMFLEKKLFLFFFINIITLFLLVGHSLLAGIRPLPLVGGLNILSPHWFISSLKRVREDKRARERPDQGQSGQKGAERERKGERERIQTKEKCSVRPPRDGYFPLHALSGVTSTYK